MLIEKNGKIRTYIVLGLILAPIIVSGGILSSNFASADESIGVNASVNVPASCTMSGSGMASHSANLINGTYTPDIGTTTMRVVCNDNAGFSIYAAGFTGSMLGGANSDKLVGTAASGNATIDTGTATGPGYDDESNWAMKLDTDYYAEYPITIVDNYDYYSEVPNSYTKVATRLTGTDAGIGATGASLTTTYAAYISKTQPADTYSGQVKYVLVHPNNADVPGTFASAYQSAGKTKLNNYYKMQDMNDAICANVSEYQTATLIDTRDNNTYTVAKLAGACWMTQNLRITGTVSSAGSNFSTYNSVDVCDGDLTSGNSYDEARCHDSNSSTYGIWYNFAAASAETIVGDDNPDDATEDICPAGWHLPNYNTNRSAGSVNSITSEYFQTFSAVGGGWYEDGTLMDSQNSVMWTSMDSGDDAYGRRSGRFILVVYDGGPQISFNAGSRSLGGYVRCVSESKPTMQAQTASSLAAAMPNEGDSAVFRDSRDGLEYEVTKINGDYWMTQNLRFTGTNLDPSTSNVASPITITYGDLAESGNPNRDDAAMIHEGVDDNNDPTVWYNYAAASAMTITGPSNDTDATYDICPAGWRLPTGSEFSGIVSYASVFDPVAGNMYYDGTLFGPGGFWWSTTAGNTEAAVTRYNLIWDNNNLSVDGAAPRVYGFYVRCVKK